MIGFSVESPIFTSEIMVLGFCASLKSSQLCSFQFVVNS